MSRTGTMYAKVVEGSFTASKFYDFIEALLLRQADLDAQAPFFIEILAWGGLNTRYKANIL